MERYAPTLKDLAPRDMVSRAISIELREGRGIGPQKDYVHLDLTHLDPKVIHEKLPDITDFVETYLGIDPVKAPIPIQPTAHYAMGGIPTNFDGEVVIDEKKTVMPGLYAAGECACVSVHGANRLGTNSLVDIIVFGRRGGKALGKFVQNAALSSLPPNPETATKERMERLFSGNGKESVASIRSLMQAEMMDKVSVFRVESDLKKALQTLSDLRGRYREVRLQDRGKKFNMELLEAFELDHLLELSQVTAAGALARQESRGAHCREDFPKRDDPRFLKHTLAYRRDGPVELKYKPVSITRFQPQERKY